jgi:hypothetical protein
MVRRCETWLANSFRTHDAAQEVVRSSDVPERTIKRRFKGATGVALIDMCKTCVSRRRSDSSKRVPLEWTKSARAVATRTPRFFAACSVGAPDSARPNIGECLSRSFALEPDRRISRADSTEGSVVVSRQFTRSFNRFRAGGPAWV